MEPARRNARGEEWRRLDDEALEELLVERWLHRGLLLGIILLAAAVTTLLGARGLAGWREEVLVGILVALGLVLGAIVFAMRQRDLAIHRELRRRRRARPGADG
jgi:hypothetical protein